MKRDEPTPYQKPALEKLGSLRDLTQAGGCFAVADGANPYHRYDPAGNTCGFQ